MIFCRKFFFSQCRKTSQGNPSEFQKVSGFEMKLCIRKLGWVEYHELPSQVFCLRVPKKTVEESFRVSFNFGYRNFYA